MAYKVSERIQFYIVSLFTCRQRDDDRHCAEKYGTEKWVECQERVKYRIVPGIYCVLIEAKWRGAGVRFKKGVAA